MEKIPRWKKGDALTHQRLNESVDSVNKLASAIRNPQQMEDPSDQINDEGGGGAIGDEVFNAAATDITSETITITDDGGNDHDIERITQIVLTEKDSGRTMTLNITYT